MFPGCPGDLNAMDSLKMKGDIPLQCDEEPWPSDLVVGDKVGTLADMTDALSESLTVLPFLM